MLGDEGSGIFRNPSSFYMYMYVCMYVIERAKRAHSLVMTFEIFRICIYVFRYVNGGAI